MLHLQLRRQPNPAWIHRFQNLGSYQSILGKGPERFEFRGSRAYIPAGDNDAQLLVNYFKGYIAQTNRAYVDDVEAARLKAIEQSCRELQERIAQEEKRQRILESIQI